MNQILSVEMPQKRSKNRNRGSNKKMMPTILCIILIMFGIALIGVGGYSMFAGGDTEANNDDETTNSVANSEDPRIDITQNGDTIDVEISSSYNISKVEYHWNSRDPEETEYSDSIQKNIKLNIKIPSTNDGKATFYITATDENEHYTYYTNNYPGPIAPKVIVDGMEDGKLAVKCEEDKMVKSLVYYYDNDTTQAKTIDINNTNAKVQIELVQGKHDLTIKLKYEDGDEREITNDIFVPIIERVKVSQDLSSFIIKASDKCKIEKVRMNFNGTDLPEETVDSETFEKTLKLESGDNRLILTVENSNGISFTTRTRYIKNN